MSSSTTSTTKLWDRIVSVIVTDLKTGKGLELGELEITFHVHHNTFIVPHTADLTIYNMHPDTITRIKKEFNGLVIRAGYPGNFGTIFTGTIKQVRYGRTDGADTFVTITAADGDEAYTEAVMGKTLDSGYTQRQVWAAIGETISGTNTLAPLPDGLKDIKASRGKVMFGPLKDFVRDFADSNKVLTTIDHGVLTAMPVFAGKPGDAVILNSTSGMVGVPEQTDVGVNVRMLLNPAVSWGKTIYINERDIVQTQVIAQGDQTTPGQVHIGFQAPLPILPAISPNGLYKVLTADHNGSTRGNDFYTTVVCMSINPTTAWDAGIGVGYAPARLGVLAPPGTIGDPEKAAALVAPPGG